MILSKSLDMWGGEAYLVYIVSFDGVIQCVFRSTETAFEGIRTQIGDRDPTGIEPVLNYNSDHGETFREWTYFDHNVREAIIY